MLPYQSVCDELYASLRIHTKLDLAPSRETVLHLFEALQRRYSTLNRLRHRDDGGLMLEEPDDAEARRWIRLESGGLRIGQDRPSDLGELGRFVGTVLEYAAPALSLSPLDYDNWEAVLGFDLDYTGNHDELIAGALFGLTPVHRLWEGDGQQAIDCQPLFGISLTSACDLQAYIEVKSRTNTYEVRTQDYERASITTLLTIRKYWGVSGDTDVQATVQQLLALVDDWAVNKVIPLVVQPLAQAIASRR